MTEWWSEQTSALIGAFAGAGLGVLAGLYGTLAGTLAPRGIGRRPMLAVHIALLTLGVATLILRIAALVVGQPYHVWYPLGLIGLVLVVVLGPLYPVVRARYAQAEYRRLTAEEFRRG
jgi:uncharacterized membrane protein